MKIDNFFAELKRRNVYKVAVAYAVVAWLLIQIATQVFPIFEIPNWAGRLVVLLLILGFPVALIFSWAFEITPEGIKLESEIEPSKSIKRGTGRKIVAMTIALAVVAAGLFVYQLVRSKATVTPRQHASAARTRAAPVAPNKSIAVLPFVNMSADKNDEYLSDGMTEELLNVLTKVKSLHVPGRSSSFALKEGLTKTFFEKSASNFTSMPCLKAAYAKPATSCGLLLSSSM